MSVVGLPYARARRRGGRPGDAQNERLLTGNTEILKQVAALEARILGMEQTILAAVGAEGLVEGGRKD